MDDWKSYYPRLGHFAAGDWSFDSEGQAIVVVDPSTEHTIGLLPKAGPGQLDAMLRAAAGAFADWSRTPVRERARYLVDAARLIEQRAETIARIVTLEQGKPLAEALQEVRRAAGLIAWNANAAVELFEAEGERAIAGDSVVLRPVGPVAAFTPWNVPVLSPARKISMALACGCPCIIKPAEETPGSAQELVRAFVDVGLPNGVLGLAFGDPAFISDYLIRSPVIRKVTFTGSVPVGKHLAALAGSLMKPVTMELGGHNAVLVFDDVDIDAVAAMAVNGKFRNAGQICTSPTRFYVQASAFDAFLDAFRAGAASLKVGSGFEAGTQMGPLVSRRRLDAIQDLVDDAVATGSRLVTGGERRGEQGYFFSPTILTDVPDTARFMTEEPFGPVASVAAFGTLDEGIALANHDSLGLASYVHTADAETARHAAERLDSGVVGVNTFSVSRPELPFGGIKDSGYGREGGREGLLEFLVAKAVAR